jgi:hypothetical protein
MYLGIIYMDRTTYHCKSCDFKTNNLKDWKRHLSTQKHSKSLKKTENFFCDKCNKGYKFKSGLSRHLKTCVETSKDEKYVNNLETIINKIIEENSKTLNNIIPYIGTSINNKMTINLFLNEQCKNAMNISEFVDKLNLSLEDLMYTINNGYVKGISNIFVKNLKELEPTMRPIHCSDVKRLQFYVKDENEWIKEKANEKISRTISQISNKQLNKIKEWEMNNPDWSNSEQLREKFLNMLENVLDDKENNNELSIKREISNSIDIKNTLVKK